MIVIRHDGLVVVFVDAIGQVVGSSNVCTLAGGFSFPFSPSHSTIDDITSIATPTTTLYFHTKFAGCCHIFSLQVNV